VHEVPVARCPHWHLVLSVFSTVDPSRHQVLAYWVLLCISLKLFGHLCIFLNEALLKPSNLLPNIKMTCHSFLICRNSLSGFKCSVTSMYCGNFLTVWSLYFNFHNGVFKLAEFFKWIYHFFLFHELCFLSTVQVILTNDELSKIFYISF
jgi:hypothetical protein